MAIVYHIQPVLGSGILLLNFLRLTGKLTLMSEQSPSEGQPQTIEQQIQNMGQDLARTYGAHDLAGLNRALTASPVPERINDVLKEWAMQVAASRITLPSEALTIPAEKRPTLKEAYANALREEAGAILTGRQEAMAREKKLAELTTSLLTQPSPVSSA
jgi:hypothetical protein